MPAHASSVHASSSALMARFGLAASPSAPYQARCHVRHTMASWGIGGEVIETAALIASELVANAANATNAANAANAAGAASVGNILLTLCYARQALRIEVSDVSTNPPMLTQVPPEAESGRGMLIIDALTTEWSYSFLPAGLGKTVYCVLPTDDRPGADDDLRAAS
jgi:anti-sigma regulatory factor (Ser/Thr protein kinase)